MKKILLLFTLLALVLQINLQAQSKDLFSKVSLSFGSSSQGIFGRFDLSLKRYDFTSTRFYLDVAVKKYTFSRSTFIHENITYSSDASVTSLGIGLGQEILKGHLTITPFIGLRYYYGRFTDQELVDAIGSSKLQRYIYYSNGNNISVGPVVENGYGDIVGLELGSRVGLKLFKLLEIGGTIAYTPANFDTPKTLFGKYWGESPYKNDYYIKLPRANLEVFLRLNF